MVALLVATPAFGRAATDEYTSVGASRYGTLEALIIDMASTPQQHQVAALYYRERAADAAKRMQLHAELAEIYLGRNELELRAHCLTLIDEYHKVAETYAQLARLHDDMARETNL